jgi:hypothetical protein
MPVRLMSITWRQAFGSVSSIDLTRAMPALFTSTDAGPNASSAAATVAAGSASPRDVEAGEDRLIAEFVGERPSLLLEYIRDHNIRAFGDEAARVAGTHSTGTARDNHCPIIETIQDSFF